MSKYRVILIDVLLKNLPQKIAYNRLYELENLITTYGGMVVLKKIQKKYKPDYKTFLSPQKATEILAEAKQLKANLIIVNNQLKSQQVYNLNELFKKDNIELWDRIDLILKIFARHAQTVEAKLEIELASLQHFGPRIFKMGTELMRQGGGIGTLGIGETNIERMKRHIKERERIILKKLEKASQVRQQNRQSRQKQNLKTVALVGYTNAGKSALLKALTKKEVEVADKLFTTLDTRVGHTFLENGYKILVSDTIGFISDLPPQLIKSFKSTLEDSVHADLIIHVIDYADPLYKQKIKVVTDILEQLKANNKPIIMAFNKIDLLKKVPKKTILKKYKKFHPVFISAEGKQGLEELKRQISYLISDR